MKKLIFTGISVGVFLSFGWGAGSIAAPGTCTSNKNRCHGHCNAQGGSKQSWCLADCNGRWQECMQNGRWRYDDVSGRGAITGVQKQ